MRRRFVTVLRFKKKKMHTHGGSSRVHLEFFVRTSRLLFSLVVRGSIGVIRIQRFSRFREKIDGVAVANGVELENDRGVTMAT